MGPADLYHMGKSFIIKFWPQYKITSLESNMGDILLIYNLKQFKNGHYNYAFDCLTPYQ